MKTMQEAIDAGLLREYFNIRFEYGMQTDRWKNASEEDKKEAILRGEASCMDYLNKLRTEIENKDVSLLSTLHRGNKFSKKFFTFITGISLPSSDRDTEPVLMSFIGLNKVSEHKINLQKLKEEEEQLYQAKLAEEHKEFIEKASKKMLAHEELSCEEFLALCKHAGIKIHARTLGAIRANLVSIKPTVANLRKNYNLETTYDCYVECFNKLKG